MIFYAHWDAYGGQHTLVEADSEQEAAELAVRSIRTLFGEDNPVVTIRVATEDEIEWGNYSPLTREEVEQTETLLGAA